MKTLLIVVACLLPGWLAAQTLAYSQTLWITSASGTVSVPTGKVWKIEAVTFSSSLPSPICTTSTSCTSTSLTDNISINSTTTTMRSVRASGSATGGIGNSIYLWEQKLPLWLPEGSTLATSTGVSAISVIEFSELP